MKPRDYVSTGQALASNVKTLCRKHPDSFECLIYRPDFSDPETVANNDDVVGSMESSERALTYADPQPGRAFRVVEGAFWMEVAKQGDIADGNMEQPLILLVDPDDELPVPEQAVIQYEEMTDEENRRLVSIYVIKNDLVGSAPGGTIRHYCIPFEGFEGATP